MLTGCKDLRKVEDFSECYLERIPDTTVHDVLIRISPEPLRALIAEEVKKALRTHELPKEDFPLRIIPIDGKCVSISKQSVGDFSQRSECNDTVMFVNRVLRAMYVSSEIKLVLAQREICGKTSETGSFENTRRVHRSITDTYLDDFSKYAKQKDLLLLQKIFNSIPGNIGKKIKNSNLSRNDKSRNIKYSIQLLSKARICNMIFHSHCSGVPLHANIDDSIFKLIFLDVGLVNNILGTDWQSVSRLDERELVNEGPLAEQFIGQHLLDFETSQGSSHLNYWLRDGRSANAEVDYVISSGKEIIPIEVKSGKSGSLKSLQQFAAVKNAGFAVRFDLNEPSLQDVVHSISSTNGIVDVNFKLLSLPCYAVEKLPRIIKNMR